MEEGEEEELPGEEDGEEGEPELFRRGRISPNWTRHLFIEEWKKWPGQNGITKPVFPGLLGPFSCVWQRWNSLSSSLGGLNLHRSCVIYMHAAICFPALPLHPILNVPGDQRDFLLNHHPPLQAWNQSTGITHIFTVWVYIREITAY